MRGCSRFFRWHTKLRLKLAKFIEAIKKACHVTLCRKHILEYLDRWMYSFASFTQFMYLILT